MPQIYAEDIGNYWKTGQSSPDEWIAKARREIALAGGKVLNEAFGKDDTGRAAYMLEFTFAADTFRVVWPVLRSRTNNERAARIQAATMLYHDIKAKAVSAKVHGMRASFFQYLLLPDGRTASQVATPAIIEMYPRLLSSGE